MAETTAKTQAKTKAEYIKNTGLYTGGNRCNMEIKPGYKTSEFWLTFITTVLSLLVAIGAITAEEKETFAGMAAVVVPALAVIITAAISIWRYIDSRVKIKGMPIVTNITYRHPDIET